MAITGWCPICGEPGPLGEVHRCSGPDPRDARIAELEREVARLRGALMDAHAALAWHSSQSPRAAAAVQRIDEALATHSEDAPKPSASEHRIERDLPRFIEGLKDGPLGTEPAEHAALLKGVSDAIDDLAALEATVRSYGWTVTADEVRAVRVKLSELRTAKGAGT